MKKEVPGGAWGAQSVKQLPWAQAMISGSWDRVLHRVPCSGGSQLLPLPLHLPTSPCTVSLSNK